MYNIQVFGDTFGVGSTKDHAVNWRSNTMAFVDVVSTNAGNDVVVNGWVTGAGSPAARELIHSAHDTSGRSEVTCIPTAGWSDGKTIFLWYMSVVIFNGDSWACNNASIASSDGAEPQDAMYTKQQEKVYWPGSSNFLMFAVVHYNATDHAAAADARYEPPC